MYAMNLTKKINNLRDKMLGSRIKYRKDKLKSIKCKSVWNA